MTYILQRIPVFRQVDVDGVDGRNDTVAIAEQPSLPIGVGTVSK